MRGLREIAVLARMIPNGTAALSPFVATYARDYRNWPQLKLLFRSNPALEDSALSALATDAANTEAVLALASSRPPGEPRLWAGALLSALVQSGDYSRAYQVWRSIAQRRSGSTGLIYDAAFTDATSPAPFNWTLASSTLGLAERQPNGRLHVVYYGRDDGVLAGQLLLLKPGHYRLTMQASGDLPNAGSLSWTVTCANSATQLAAIPVAAATGQQFAVPANCPAQRLELKGSAPELPETVDVTFAGLKLETVQ